MTACERYPEAAVIDFRLPGPDGLVLAGPLQALHLQMPLALATARSDVLSRARAVRAACLPKPLRPDRLGAFSGQAESSLDRGAF